MFGWLRELVDLLQSPEAATWQMCSETITTADIHHHSNSHAAAQTAWWQHGRCKRQHSQATGYAVFGVYNITVHCRHVHCLLELACHTLNEMSEL